MQTYIYIDLHTYIHLHSYIYVYTLTYLHTYINAYTVFFYCTPCFTLSARMLYNVFRHQTTSYSTLVRTQRWTCKIRNFTK